MLNAAELRGLLPRRARDLPLLLYVHENQLSYPVQRSDPRDLHYGWSQALSAAAADRVLWNSAFNRDGFLRELEDLIRRMPAPRPVDLVENIQEKSRVLPVPLDVAGWAGARSPRTGAAHILWNHRWEHDKDPQALFSALETLVSEGLDFRVSVVGESFREVPQVFSEGRERLGRRVLHWGNIEDRERYRAILASADTAVSTARHEFQGLSILEAASAGAVPLVPDALVYPEIWPPRYRYRPGKLTDGLRDRIGAVDHWRGEDARRYCDRFDWQHLLPEWLGLFGGILAAAPRPPAPSDEIDP
jgi:glycosyltransferase involved in cell wall biosynthesis